MINKKKIKSTIIDRIKMCIIYVKDTLSFIAGIQNVFIVEVSNRYYALCVFCIPQLCLGHKKTHRA